ncbi:MAG: hypothetical protein ACWA42_09530 [Lutibacter sp.]
MKRKKEHKVIKLNNLKITKTGFVAPKNYFNNLEDTVLTKINLSNTKKESAFSIPEDYFGNVEDRVLAKLKSEKLYENVEDSSIPENYFENFEERVFEKLKTKNKVVSLNRFLKIAAPILAAASLALILFLNRNNSSINFDTLQTASIENYFESNFDGIDETNLMALYNENITSVNLNDNLTDSAVENYLSEEDLDNLLYEN